MIAAACLIALTSPVRIACLGVGSESLRTELAGLLGPNYEIRAFADRGRAAAFRPSYLFLEPMESADSTSYDTFVPALKATVKALTGLPGKPKVFLCLAAAKSEASRIYTRPLTIQAAREAGVVTVDGDSDAVLARQLFSLIIDWKMDKAGWKLVSADSEETDEGPARNAIDGDPDTYWHTRYSPTPSKYPHELVVDMGSARKVGGFRYLPRQDGGRNGMVKAFEFSVSLDGKTWTTPVASGTFSNTTSATLVALPAPVEARFFRFKALSEQSGQPFASAAELDALPGNFAHS